MEKYGEILMVCECNQNCYYCLGKQMNKLQNVLNTSSQLHFSLWKNFDSYIAMLRSNKINLIYISSTIGEPLIYTHIDELFEYLSHLGFTIGLRTNGLLVNEHFDSIVKLNGEISVSINSLNKSSNYAICKSNKLFDYKQVLPKFISNNKKIRLAIVVNSFNKLEIFNMIRLLAEYKEAIQYIQLRRIYNYYETVNNEDTDAFDYIMSMINKYTKIGSYYESDIYDVFGLSVSIWQDIFDKESIQSFNYFTDGVYTNDTLLVRGYEERI